MGGVHGLHGLAPVRDLRRRGRAEEAGKLGEEGALVGRVITGDGHCGGSGASHLSTSRYESRSGRGGRRRGVGCEGGFGLLGVLLGLGGVEPSLRLRVGTVAVEVLAAALARVHAVDPLEELALLAAVEAARWFGLLGLLLVAGFVLGRVAVGDEAELLGAARKGSELGARRSRAEDLLDERDGVVHGLRRTGAQREHPELVLVADVGVDLRELVHDLEPGAVSLLRLDRGRQHGLELFVLLDEGREILLRDRGPMELVEDVGVERRLDERRVGRLGFGGLRAQEVEESPAAALGGCAEAPGDDLVGDNAEHSLEELVILRLAHLGRDDELGVKVGRLGRHGGERSLLAGWSRVVLGDARRGGHVRVRERAHTVRVSRVGEECCGSEGIDGNLAIAQEDRAVREERLKQAVVDEVLVEGLEDARELGGIARVHDGLAVGIGRC